MRHCKGKNLIFAAISIGIIVILTSAAVESTCPSGQELGHLSLQGEFTPFRIALDLSGNAYITDNRNGYVAVFDYSGKQLANHTMPSPLGIAVSGDNIYVGRADGARGHYSGAVDVFDNRFKLLYRLGSGEGEFAYPVDILLNGGRIHVVDSKADIVKVYDESSGTFLFEFGSGILVRPSSIAAHPVTGDLYIADRTTVTDPETGDTAIGAGIKVFTSEGQFVAGMGTYGFEEIPGHISMPSGIEIDDAGRVMVADFTMGYLHVFDEASNALCLFKYPGFAGALPHGMALGADGRLLIAAVEKVLIVGLEGYNKLNVTPSELSLEAKVCGPAPDAMSLTITNEGEGSMRYSLEPDAAWLIPSVTSGEIIGAGSAEVTIGVDTGGLGEGTYSASLSISTPGASYVVPVSLNVTRPVLTVSPQSIYFSAMETLPSPQHLIVSLDGGYSWNATGDADWLGLDPSSGSADSTSVLQVNAYAGALESGTYTGNITVSSDCEQIESAVVPVTLDYTSGGIISVYTNHEGATFEIKGLATYSGSGKSFTVSGVPTGSYTVEFGDIEGFLVPPARSIEVVTGQEVSVNAEYVDLRRRLSILATMGNIAGQIHNDLYVYDGDGTLMMTLPMHDPVTGKDYLDNSMAASGDVDSDGAEEIIVSHDAGVVTVFEIGGSTVAGLDFRPFGERAYVDLDVADLDGDGIDEIIVSSINWSDNGSAVRVFAYSTGEIIDTGIYFMAYSDNDWTNPAGYKNRRGARVATGDMDGDGIPEIVTVQGGGYSEHEVRVRIFKVTTIEGAGSWDVADAGEIRADGGYSYWSDLATADLDSDGVDEVIVSSCPMDTELTQNIKVAAYDTAGDKVLELTVESIRGVEVAAGDLDYDGVADIVVADGAFREGETSRIWVFDAGGSLKDEFTAFDDKVKGARVSVGLGH